MKKRTLLTSILTIVMCLSLCVGATFALFTSQSEVNVAVTSANVNVKATASELDTNVYSGSATKVGNEITVERLVPGDSFSFDIKIENYSDVTVQYRTIISNNDNGGLFKALRVTLDDGANKRVYNGGYVYEDWATLSAGDNNANTPEDVKTINVLVEFPDTGVPQNEYQNKSCSMNVLVEAVQGNAEVVNPITKISNRHYQINDEKGMMLIDGILAGVYTNEGVECKLELTDDIDMSGYAWSPISKMWVQFEGNGHTISNLNCTTDDWGRSGFFGYLAGGYVKNLTLENVTAEGTQVGVVAGAFEGRVENVTIKGNNSVKYNREINTEETCGGVGAVMGIAQYVPTNVVIDGNVVVDYNGLVTSAYLKNELAQMVDITAGVTVNGNVTVNGEPTRGFYVTNSTELKTMLDFINSGKYYNISLVNDPITLIMKAGVYTGNYQLRQFPATDGSTIINNYFNADRTYVTFLGEDGVQFKGYIKISGYGNGQGTYGGYVLNTEFKNIEFNGEDLPYVNNGKDRYNIESGSGADNIVFTNCTFKNTTHVNFGGSGTNGTGDITFNNCQFKDAGCITGGVESFTFNNCNYDGSKNGFASAQRGDSDTGYIYVNNSTIVNVQEYGFRTRAHGKVIAKDSTIKVIDSEEVGLGSLVLYRGNYATAQFTNCNLEYSLVASYTDQSYANSCSVSIDGNQVASLVKDGDIWRVYDVNGLLEVNSLIANYNVSGKGNLQFISDKTISIEKDINANGNVWNCLTMTDLHGATNGFIFDGNGHTISNLVINGAAMFRKHSSNGVADPTVFKNITFDNVVNDGNEYFSAVIWAEMYGEIEFNNVKIVNSNISGACNVAAFIGRNGAAHKGSEIKFVDCSVENTVITANAVESDDNAGASYFLGNALRGGDTTLKLTFAGENKYNNVTLNNNEYVVGGGVYTKADYTDAASWANPEVVYGFDNYES